MLLSILVFHHFEEWEGWNAWVSQILEVKFDIIVGNICLKIFQDMYIKCIVIYKHVIYYLCVKYAKRV